MFVCFYFAEEVDCWT